MALHRDTVRDIRGQNKQERATRVIGASNCCDVLQHEFTNPRRELNITREKGVCTTLFASLVLSSIYSPSPLPTRWS